jgi:tRNA(Arg) A34 adenosine deaminase TadA
MEKMTSSLPTSASPELMRRALALAAENVSSGRGGPFGALVVRNGEILAEAANTVTTTLDPTAHAEVNAIRAACHALGSFSLAGSTLYTSCEPCPMCMAAALWARVDAVYYAASAADAARAGFDDAAFYEELRRSADERHLPTRQILAAESWPPFAAWLVAAEKTAY